MEIAHVYSHLNGLEFMLVRKPELWREIQEAIQNIDAGLAFDKVSREKTMAGRILYSPAKLIRHNSIPADGMKSGMITL